MIVRFPGYLGFIGRTGRAQDGKNRQVLRRSNTRQSTGSTHGRGRWHARGVAGREQRLQPRGREPHGDVGQAVGEREAADALEADMPRFCALLVKEGLAKARDDYQEMEARARSARIGLWE